MRRTMEPRRAVERGPRGALGGTASGSAAALPAPGHADYDFGWGEPDYDFRWGEPEPTEVMFVDPMLRLQQLSDVEKYVLRAPTPRVEHALPPPSPRRRFESTLDAFDAFLSAKEQAKRKAEARGQKGGRLALGLKAISDASTLLQDRAVEAAAWRHVEARRHPPAHAPAAPAAAPCKDKDRPLWKQSSPTPGLPRAGGHSLGRERFDRYV